MVGTLIPTKLTLKTQTMVKKLEQIDCRDCKHSNKTKIGNGMIWCNKLKVYRAFGLRYCKTSVL